MAGLVCEISTFGSFWVTYFALSALALTSLLVASGVVFYFYYVKATFEKWQWKSNPAYPSPQKVRSEILQMLKGMFTAVVPPTLALYLTHNEYPMFQAYCGVEPHGWGYLAATAVLVWVGSDFYEFFYHRCGHVYKSFWSQHKWHHLFFNPSPFAVIADEVVDQFMRALPLLVFPMLTPINMDLLFFTYALFFYGYGVYLHWGYELPYPDAHHPWINTAFQHYCHHAKAVMGKPYHCGFFLKLWDQLFDRPDLPMIYNKGCFCAKCAQAKGERSREAWEKVVVPDYSPLISWRFWLSPTKDVSDEASPRNAGKS